MAHFVWRARWRVYLGLDEPDPPKQDICCSRMFGKRPAKIEPIKEAVATYVHRAAEKL